jgi:hypothetical protein
VSLGGACAEMRLAARSVTVASFKPGSSVWPFSPACGRGAGRVRRSGLRVRGRSRGGRCSVAAVGPAGDHNLDGCVLEVDDPIDPLAAERPGLVAVEAEQREKSDCLVEVLDEADVDKVGDAGGVAHFCAPLLGFL